MRQRESMAHPALYTHKYVVGNKHLEDMRLDQESRLPQATHRLAHPRATSGETLNGIKGLSYTQLARYVVYTALQSSSGRVRIK